MSFTERKAMWELSEISEEFYQNKLSLERENGADPDVNDNDGNLPIQYAEDEEKRQLILRFQSTEHLWTPRGTTPTDEGENATHYELITDAPPDLILQEDEAIISCGIRFSPSGAKLSTPVKVTLDHSAHFTYPRRAEIVFYTRSIDTEHFVRIPNSPSGDYPHCDVRTYDLDLFVDHFSDWWIIAVIKRHFTAKRVVCTPYLQHPLPIGFTNILLYIHDDYPKVHKIVETETTGYRTALPPLPLSVPRRSGNFKITLCERQDSYNKQGKRIEEEKMITTKDIYRKNRNYVPFTVETPAAQTRQKVLRFILDQDRSQSDPIEIPVIMSYDGAHGVAQTGIGIQPGKLSQLAQVHPVTDGQLDELSKHIPGDNYFSLSDHLGKGYNEAKNILVTLGNNIQKASRDCLAHWKTRTGGDLTDLKTVLEKSDLGGLWRFVEQT